LDTEIHKTKETHHPTGHSMLVHNGYQKKTSSTQTSYFFRRSVEEHEQEQRQESAQKCLTVLFDFIAIIQLCYLQGKVWPCLLRCKLILLCILKLFVAFLLPTEDGTFDNF